MGSFEPRICARALQAQGYSHPGRRVPPRPHPAGETFMPDPMARRTVLAALLAMAAATSASTSLAQSSRLTFAQWVESFRPRAGAWRIGSDLQSGDGGHQARHRGLCA